MKYSVSKATSKFGDTNSSQRGAFLLIMVLTIGIVTSLALSSYLILLSSANRTIASQFRTQQAFYAVQASVAEFVARYLNDSNWVGELDDPYSETDAYEIFDIPIEWSLNRIGDNVIWDVTAEAWQTRRRLEAEVEVLDNQFTGKSLDIVVLLDQSGSMDDDGDASTPYGCPVTRESQDPMVSAICAGQSFVARFEDQSEIQLAIVPYATEALPISAYPHLTGSGNFGTLQTAIADLKVASCNANGCFTNIGGAINSAISLLGEIGYAHPGSEKVIVLLTDGVPTVNQAGQFCDQYSGSSSCDSQKAYSLEQADVAKDDYFVQIFAIGLGNGVDEQLLKQIASSEQHYVSAENKEDLLDAFSIVEEQIKQGLRVKVEELLPGE